MKNIYFYLLSLSFLFFSFKSKPEIDGKKEKTDPIPTKDKVGALVIPSTIAKVKAPFKTIKFERPYFKDAVVRPKLVADGLNTQIIQKAIDELSAKGGGTVVISKGKWTTGRIELKSNINLNFEDKAILKFSGQYEDFQPAVFTRFEGIEIMGNGACIYANGANNIAITGKGTLIGPYDGEIKKNIDPSIIIENDLDQNVPVANRILKGREDNRVLPPMFIAPINCKNVFIEGLTLNQTVFWNIVPIYCYNVVVRGCTINALNVPRSDGIDPSSSEEVLIEYNTIRVGDDCLAIKSGRSYDGVRVNKPCKNVIVRYNALLEGHAGISCGSESAGKAINLYVHDNVFDNTGQGLRFKTRRIRGGGGENLIFERNRINISGNAIFFDMLGSEKFVGEMAKRLPKRAINELTPKYNTIVFKDLEIENCSNFVNITGIPESLLENVSIENVNVKCNNFFKASDLKDAVIKNINVTSTNAEANLLGCSNVTFENIIFSDGKQLQVKQN